jgi:acid phosphatase
VHGSRYIAPSVETRVATLATVDGGSSMRTPRAILACLAAPALATACATHAATVAPTPAPAAARHVPNDVRWFRTSAEYRAIALQTYRLAATRVPELARGMNAGAWAVVLDADETVLDNSEYQRRRALLDSGYTEASWAAWVRERAATALPGAAEFTRGVASLGGRVAIVTGRAESLCADTRANLESAGIHADIVLCQATGEGDKNPRFRRLQQGTAQAGVAPLTIVAWVGDNIMDFPTLTQGARDDAALLEPFGRRYFILPNPMYGSWERNADR